MKKTGWGFRNPEQVSRLLTRVRADAEAERAKKLATEGILTIRFEMPYNVRCTGCDNHIGKGVRFNAEKKTIGKYLSTKILSFRMMCHCEDGTSRTAPSATTYSAFFGSV